MNDTHPDVQLKYDRMFARLSHEERAKMGCSMHDFSKEIALSQISLPHKSKATVMRELFLRFYGVDFNDEVSSRIVLAIERFHSVELNANFTR